MRDITAQLNPPVTGVYCTHLEVSGLLPPLPASNGGDETGDLDVFFAPDVVILSHTCFFFFFFTGWKQHSADLSLDFYDMILQREKKNKNNTAGKHFTIKSWCTEDPQCNLDAES